MGGKSEPQRGMFHEMEWKTEVRCTQRKGVLRCTHRKLGISVASSLSCVSLLCLPSPFEIQVMVPGGSSIYSVCAS